MPSPVGHALGGLIVGLASLRRGPATTKPVLPRWTGLSGTGDWRMLVWPVAAAMAPDVDFLWFRHGMETHSLGAAVLAGLAVLAWTRGRSPGLALAVGLAWASHVLFDWLGSDTTPPIGVMALWPVSSDYYFAHAYLFEAISRRIYRPGFWSHNLWAVGKEVLMLAPLAGAVWALRRRQLRDRASGKGPPLRD